MMDAQRNLQHDSEIVSECSEAARLLLEKARDAANWQRFNRFSRGELEAAPTKELVDVFLKSSRFSDYKARAFKLLIVKAVELGDEEAADSLLDIIWQIKGGVKRREMLEWALGAGALGEGRYEILDLIGKIKELILVEVATRLNKIKKSEEGYYIGLAKKLVEQKLLPLLEYSPPASVIEDESQGGDE
jgi:hypothetical protein